MVFKSKLDEELLKTLSDKNLFFNAFYHDGHLNMQTEFGYMSCNSISLEFVNANDGSRVIHKLELPYGYTLKIGKNSFKTIKDEKKKTKRP